MPSAKDETPASSALTEKMADILEKVLKLWTSPEQFKIDYILMNLHSITTWLLCLSYDWAESHSL